MNPVGARPSAGRGLTKCPKGHRSDSSAHFCPACGLVKVQAEEKREELMVRTFPSAQQKFRNLANHLSHGHYGESFEQTMSFMSEVVNGKASPEQAHDIQVFLTKLSKRAWEIMWKENADLDHAVRKAAKELAEERGSGETDYVASKH